MKFVISLLFFLLPFQAVLVTFLQGKVGIDVSIIRFWREIIIILLLFIGVFRELKKNDFSLKRIYKDNNLLGTTTIFIFLSFFYIFFPFFYIKTSSYLGFKYDVFFLFALIVGLYLKEFSENINHYLKILFISISINLIIFLPVYLSGNTESFYSSLGYSTKESTYTAGRPISYSQNTPGVDGKTGENRFQGSFSGPITLSVFLTVFYIIYTGYILDLVKDKRKRLIFLLIPGIFILSSIYFSYSKTSILGVLFGTILFFYLIRKIIFNKIITKRFTFISSLIIFLSIIFFVIIKRDLFLHLGSVVNRFENLTKSVEMFLYNPIGYGLGVAGPASQIGRSLESAGKDWEIGLSSSTTTHTFLPENWYVQILLEQGILGISLFLSILIIIGLKLYSISKQKKDYLSISILVGFITLCFMANFTHAFEESATSYLLFMLIGGYISINVMNKHKSKILLK